ncbi:MAG: amidohydrolase family protein [Candidatus Bathyarchaeia archaeon]
MRIIDFSVHIIPPEVGKIISQKPYFGTLSEKGKYHRYPPEHANPKFLSRLMEKCGVDMMLLSQTTPVLWGLSVEESVRVCKLSNNYVDKLCTNYPDKFVGCAIVTLLDIDSALEELDRAINELGFRCVTISTNQDGRGLDSLEFYPFYERVTKYGIPIFLHPTHWKGYPLVDVEEDMKKGWRTMQALGWPFDTSQAVWRLIFGGVLDKFPKLKIVTHHLGGMLPFFISRIRINFERFKENLKKPLNSYLEQIYADTALHGGPLGSLICGYALFGPKRMLFGSDYPFGPESLSINENIAGIKAMPIPEEEKEKILGKNAAELLKI